MFIKCLYCNDTKVFTKDDSENKGPMKRFEGKFVTRTSSGKRGDRSWFGTPLEVLKVDGKIVYVNWNVTNRPFILDPDCVDENWQEVDPTLLGLKKYEGLK